MSIKLPKKDCPRKMNDLAPLQKLPNNVGDLGKRIVATGFVKLPKKQINRPIWSHSFYPNRETQKRKTLP